MCLHKCTISLSKREALRHLSPHLRSPICGSGGHPRSPGAAHPLCPAHSADRDTAWLASFPGARGGGIRAISFQDMAFEKTWGYDIIYSFLLYCFPRRAHTHISYHIISYIIYHISYIIYHISYHIISYHIISYIHIDTDTHTYTHT